MSRLNCSPVPFPELGIGVIPPQCVSHVLPLPRDDLDDAQDASSDNSSVFSLPISTTGKTALRKTKQENTGRTKTGRDIMKVKKKKHMQYVKNRLQPKNELEIKQCV